MVMTTQCLHGQINLNVYATGRDLINAGVVPGGDMLPETALVKLMWVLGQSKDRTEVERLMATDLRGERSSRRRSMVERVTVGLEIHQQLDTHKLFCSCPSDLVEVEGPALQRRLRPTYSEMGRSTALRWHRRNAACTIAINAHHRIVAWWRRTRSHHTTLTRRRWS